MKGRSVKWRLRWLFVVIGDVGVALLACLAAFLVRAYVPLPFTSDLLPVLRFMQVTHYWIVIVVAQVVLLQYVGCYEERALVEPGRYMPATLQRRRAGLDGNPTTRRGVPRDRRRGSGDPLARAGPANRG